nr:hypothetical protein [Tanacetum cinerariifolium]
DPWLPATGIAEHSAQRSCARLAAGNDWRRRLRTLGHRTPGGPVPAA